MKGSTKVGCNIIISRYYTIKILYYQDIILSRYYTMSVHCTQFTNIAEVLQLIITVELDARVLGEHYVLINRTVIIMISQGHCNHGNQSRSQRSYSPSC